MEFWLRQLPDNQVAEIQIELSANRSDNRRLNSSQRLRACQAIESFLINSKPTCCQSLMCVRHGQMPSCQQVWESRVSACDTLHTVLIPLARYYSREEKRFFRHRSKSAIRHYFSAIRYRPQSALRNREEILNVECGMWNWPPRRRVPRQARNLPSKILLPASSILHPFTVSPPPSAIRCPRLRESSRPRARGPGR